MKQLVIIGAGGHGKVVADIAKRNGYDRIVFLDDRSISACGDYSVVGKISDADSYHCDIFVAIGNAAIRRKVQEKLQSEGHDIPTLIHPNAVLGESVKIGAGTVIMAGAVVNPCASIGNGCIINTGASVDHDCRISDYVHVSVGSHVAGTVTVGANTWIGIGVSICNNIAICNDCMIGAGAVVIKDIIESGTYIGVPARRIK